MGQFFGERRTRRVLYDKYERWWDRAIPMHHQQYREYLLHSRKFDIGNRYVLWRRAGARLAAMDFEFISESRPRRWTFR
jgi:hypothetical protein